MTVGDSPLVARLGTQLLDALQALLHALEIAAQRDGEQVLRHAMQEPARAYEGLLTVALELVLASLVEGRDATTVGAGPSVGGLYDELEADTRVHGEAMEQRFGAWCRLLGLLRAFALPPRSGRRLALDRHAFLVGRDPSEGAEVEPPSLSDAAVLRLLHSGLFVDGQRLREQCLEEEQLGRVYERLRGYTVERREHASVCVRPNRVWLSPQELLEQPAATRERWLADHGVLPETGRPLVGAVAVAEQQHADDASARNEAVLEGLRSHRATERRGGRIIPGIITEVDAGRLVVQPGAERRRTSTHYTPRSLSGPIVERTLEPLLARLRARVDDPQPTSEMLLGLRICDPAMGSGAFLLECCRCLADHVLAAWIREGRLEAVLREAGGAREPVQAARRAVARRCLYGVDRDPLAVELAELSLGLLGGDPRGMSLAHALKTGDSLVGLRPHQIAAMDWASEPEGDDAPARDLDPERSADVADVVLSAFFWPHERALTPSSLHATRKPSAAARRACLRRLQAELREWLQTPPSCPLPAALTLRRDLVREHLRPLHWALALPEVLDGPDARGMDAVLGNPPFLAGRSIASSLGRGYSDWLATMHAPSHGNADLAAYFLRQARWLLGDEGTLGFVATNTIGQGDTRATGLQPLVQGGARIYDATQGLTWPATGADVIVSIVHVAVGAPILASSVCRLDGQPVATIDSHLRARPERPDARRLAANTKRSFQGSVLLGKGFVLTPGEREALVARDPGHARHIRPYIGGEELNASPTQTHARHVIDLGDRTHEQASAACPELLAILESRVKPGRDAQRRGSLRTRWWHFAERRPGLYGAIAALPRCLVCSIHAKHSIFAFQPVDRVFSHALVVFPLPTAAAFGLLQSRVHRSWARWQGSSMRHDLRYTPSDCFETFPFPPAPALDAGSPLEALADQLYEARAAFMRAADIGLTKTYDALVDPSDRREVVVSLRALHVALDRAVLDAYGHPELAVPPYAGASPTTLARFEDEVLDMLHALNETHAAPGG